MNWRNMVVLYNLTVSHMLLHSVWNHTEPPSTHSRGVGRVIDGGVQPFMCVHFGNMFKIVVKTPLDRQQKHTSFPFSNLTSIRPEQGTKPTSFMYINMLAVQSVCTGLKNNLKHTVRGREVLYSTLFALIAIIITAGVPPLNGPI